MRKVSLLENRKRQRARNRKKRKKEKILCIKKDSSSRAFFIMGNYNVINLNFGLTVMACSTVFVTEYP